jgi:nucleotide-binding universal stress UspA family protein
VILIYYDGSDGVFTTAAALFDDREAVVLAVGPLELLAEEYAAAPWEGPRVTELVHEDTAARAEAGAALARAAGFEARARAEVDAAAWQTIVRVAEEIGASAIVVGPNPDVAHDVAAHAHRPVLVVR